MQNFETLYGMVLIMFPLHVCLDGVKDYRCDEVSNGVILLFFVKIGQLVFTVLLFIVE